MKRIAFFLLFGLLLKGFPAFSQWTVERDSTLEFVEWKHKRTNNKAIGDTLYYEDFGSGGPGINQFPAGWTNQNFAGNSNNWIWSTAAPGGQYSISIGPLNSSSGSNGFLSLPSDLYNTPAMMFVNMDAAVSSPPIPIPQKGAWLLQFQQAHRFCCFGGDSALVAEVSADGQQWTEFDATFNGWPNAATPNPQYAEINVSSVLAFEDTAYLRFRQTGPSHYYWMIDDLALVEGPTNAFQINELTFNFSDTFSVNPTYTLVPLSMVDSISLEAVVENAGAFDQTGFRIDYRLFHDSSLNGTPGSGVVFQDSIIYNQAFTAFSTDTVLFDHPKFKPNQSGYYRAEVQLKSDSMNQLAYLASQNQAFVVSDSILARDRGVYVGGFNVASPSYSSPNIDSGKAGVLFNSGAMQSQIKALRFFAQNSPHSPGSKIRPMLWEIDLDFDSSLTSSIHLVAQDTAPTTITSAMLGNWIQLPFSTDPTLSDLKLDPGKQYIMGWEQVNGANGFEFEIGRDRSMERVAPQVSNFVFYNNQNPGWGWMTRVPAVRAVIESQTVGLKSKLEKNWLNVFPNPSNGIVELEWDQEVGNYQELSVMSLSGRLVKKQAIKAGQNQLKLDLENLEKGVYIMALKSQLNWSYSKIILY
ncbi:MAG: T9SS type A sorting domain-containing protein [Vicingaceae bacterium]